MVEHCIDIAEVMGSVPIGTTIFRKNKMSLLKDEFYWGLLNYEEPFEYDKHDTGGYEIGRQFGKLYGNGADILDRDDMMLTDLGFHSFEKFNKEWYNDAE